MQQRIGGGCHLTRDTVALVNESGLQLLDSKHYYLRRIPRFGGYMTEGSAQKILSRPVVKKRRRYSASKSYAVVFALQGDAPPRSAYNACQSQAGGDRATDEMEGPMGGRLRAVMEDQRRKSRDSLSESRLFLCSCPRAR